MRYKAKFTRPACATIIVKFDLHQHSEIPVENAARETLKQKCHVDDGLYSCDSITEIE